MPSTRRSSGGPRASAASGKHATLSFHNKVTKSVPKSTKNTISDSTPTKQSPLAKHVESAEAEKVAPVDEIEPEVEAVQEDVEVQEEPAKSDAEIRAEKITDRQVTTYWKAIEAERTAKRVHQGDLGTSEKILRYFDVSSQYGVCSPSGPATCYDAS
jgi:DNA polymerase delta subunit 4